MYCFSEYPQVQKNFSAKTLLLHASESWNVLEMFWRGGMWEHKCLQHSLQTFHPAPCKMFEASADNMMYKGVSGASGGVRLCVFVLSADLYAAFLSVSTSVDTAKYM